jgi:Ca2+:H+ antiporter
MATMSLTIPALLIIGLFTDKAIIPGLGPVDMILLLPTSGLSTLTFGRSRTNALLKAVHGVMFLAYCMLIFER